MAIVALIVMPLLMWAIVFACSALYPPLTSIRWLAALCPRLCSGPVDDIPYKSALSLPIVLRLRWQRSRIVILLEIFPWRLIRAARVQLCLGHPLFYGCVLLRDLRLVPSGSLGVAAAGTLRARTSSGILHPLSHQPVTMDVDVALPEYFLNASVAIRMVLFTLMHWPTKRGNKRHRTWCLPLELWTEIFDFWFVAGSGSFRSYNHARTVACASSREWRKFIRRTGRYWTRLSLDCTSRLSSVKTHMRYALRQGSLIDVHIVFDTDEIASSHARFTGRLEDLELERQVARASACLAAVTPSVHLWRCVRLSATEDSIMAIVLAALRATPAPNITSLLIYRPNFGLMHEHDTVFAAPPRIFASELPKLVVLRIWNAALPWGDASYFGQLESLDIGEVPFEAWPTPDELSASLVSSGRLSRLEVGGGGVAFSESTVPTPFTLHSLESLSILHWSECVLFIRALSYGSFPLLRVLTVTHLDDESWDV
ncbi:hypothetical protein C8R46DRAFT_1042692 [Mycena filopes]|nr:hypothetical protein C8R46DRAFT_1042692 [Mycena filopes]